MPDDTLATKGIAPGNLAVITGGADGIGLACAGRLLQRGMRVALIDVNEQQLEAAEHTLAADGAEPDNIATYAANVTDRDAMMVLAAAVNEAHGPVSLLMNNAAIAKNPGNPWANPQDWDQLLGVNLGGVMNGVFAFLPAMVAGGAPGAVINTGSKQGITRPPGNAAYNVSKTAVLGYTEMLAHALRNTDGCAITAHLLIPGFTYTGMIRQFLPEKPEGAWWPEQVADFMLGSLAEGNFYILCPDNDVDRATDEKRIAWNAGDIIENRPALSRWHPDHADDFDAFMAAD